MGKGDAVSDLTHQLFHSFPVFGTAGSDIALEGCVPRQDVALAVSQELGDGNDSPRSGGQLARYNGLQGLNHFPRRW